MGFLGVALGAFGAHALQELLQSRATTHLWETAVFYHLTHAIAVWVLGIRSEPLSPALCRTGIAWLVGIALFSGSLYGMALGGPRWLGPITPLGGLALIVGWILAARHAWGSPNPDRHD